MDTFDFMQKNGVAFFCTGPEDDRYDNVSQPERRLSDNTQEASSEHINKSEVL